jgi:tRNA A-37 threonylcarbamoyl transferase component Bud32
MRRAGELLCLALLWAATAHAQHYSFIQMTPRPPASCLTPFQDSHGRLWLAGCETGSEGLFYFDGARYISPVQSGALKGIVRGMAEDSEGGVWIASTGGIFRLKKDHLEKIADGVAAAGITRVATDIFLATIGKSGTDLLSDAQTVRISRHEGGWKSEILIASIPQVQFRLDHSGHVLYGCAGGFCELSADAITRWHPGTDLQVARHRLDTRMNYAGAESVVLRDASSCIWLRNPIDATYQCPGDARPTTLPFGDSSEGYPQIFELDDGTIVIPAYAKLMLGRPGMFREITREQGYSGSVTAFLDREGGLWLSTGYLLPLHMRIEYWSGEESLLVSPRSILRLNGNVFASSRDSVWMLSPKRDHWQSIFKFNHASHLVSGPGQTLLIGSFTDGIVQIDTKGKILRRSAPAEVATMIHAPNEQWWALGSTVYRVVFEPNRLSLEAADVPASPTSTGDAKIDRQGDFWACYSGGLAHKEKKGWRVLSAKDGLLENRCGSLAIDRNGDLWYGYETLHDFSFIQNPLSAKPSFQHFSDADGDGVGPAISYFFNSDHRGWLWRGAADGIYVAETEQARQGMWFHLDRKDGLPDVDATAGSFFEDDDGSVWFGTEGALVHLNPPPDLVHPKYPPSVFISTFSQNDGAARMADSVGNIGYGSDISAHIGALQIDRPNALRLRYRLMPEHPHWISTRTVDLHLGTLSLGRHTLQVQAQLQSGPWSATSEQSFSVLPPLWFSWPALIAFGVGGTAVGIGGARWTVRQRLRRKLTLPDLTSWRMKALSPESGELIGTVVNGRYEIGHILSIGGFATVVRARDLGEDGALRAIKLFRHEFGNQAWVLHRFEQEVKVLEQLTHPNIVRITAHGMIDGGAPYLVMEFIHGQSLRAMLEEGALPPKVIARFLRQLASALETLHQSMIFHRDIKPENLMIRSDENNESEIVIIDFSIAIVKSPEHTFHGISRVAGTLEYMAPEQVIGYADATTDIYSLAKVVMEMMSGSAWANLLPQATLDLPKQVRSYLVKYHGLLSIGSVEMIASALMFDPERRPKHVSLFVEPIIRDLDQAP